MASTVSLPPPDRAVPSASVPSVRSASVPSDRFVASAPAYDHAEPAARPRPRFRRLVVFTGKLP
jgi:hypothetical protein